MKCKAKTKAGKPCSRAALPGSDYCYVHDPALSKERSAQASQAARSARPRAVLPDGIEIPLLDRLEKLAPFITEQIRAVLTGQVDVKVSNSAAYWTGLLIRVLEKTDLEERIRRLEVQLGLDHDNTGAPLPPTDAEKR